MIYGYLVWMMGKGGERRVCWKGGWIFEVLGGIFWVWGRRGGEG